MKKYLILLAGGSGTRFGGEIPKQFLDLCSRPVLQQTMLKFLYACPDIEPVVVLPKEHTDFWKDLCRKTHFDQRQTLIQGGITRFHSVRNALEAVPDGAMVLVHDGVRPLLSVELIKRMISLGEKGECIVPLVPVTDTLKSAIRLPDGRIVQADVPNPVRKTSWCAQTPQVFPSDAIKDAYTLAYSEAFTDDASVLEAKGFRITYTDGEKLNFKITTKEDLDLARLIFEG